MRSKEVSEAINTIKEFRKTGYCTLLLKCDNDRIRANTRIETSIETVLAYIEELEKKNKGMLETYELGKASARERIEYDYVPKQVIRDKIKELEIYKFTSSKQCKKAYEDRIKDLKEIIGE